MNSTEVSTIETTMLKPAYGTAQTPAGVRIVLFGDFGGPNIGNESTLYTLLCHLRELIPAISWVCACTGPEKANADYHIAAVPCRPTYDTPAREQTLFGKISHRTTGLAREAARWRGGFQVLRGARAMIIPGTGLLTDAYGLRGWGPYDLFRWTITAKFCGCQVLFVSVGAGPVESRAGKFFIRFSLSVADFRSYRDESSREYLAKIGSRVLGDPVYPDLVFSLPHRIPTARGRSCTARLTVGIGLISYAGRYSGENPDGSTHKHYLESMVIFVRWLLAHDYNVRLLIGDLADKPVIEKFKSLLKRSPPSYDDSRILDDEITSVEQLLLQLAETDVVIATRFHNVLLSLISQKPVIAISFHPKVASLMNSMGLSDYCENIHSVEGEQLIKKFLQIQQNAQHVTSLIRERAEAFRRELKQQYQTIAELILSNNHRAATTPPESERNIVL